MTKPNKFDHEAAVEMWRGGMTFSQVASAVGVSPQAARYAIVLHAPTEYGAWRRERQERARSYRTCPGCGGNRSARAGRMGGTCMSCARRDGRMGKPMKWPREAILERIRAWTEVYGQPPGAQDWNPAMARNVGRNDIAERWEKDGCWPYTFTVQTRFGSWNAAIAAAGFTPRRPGGRGPGTPPVVPLCAA